MGVWDSGSFGNDTALDFVSDLTDVAQIPGILEKFDQSTGSLDADDASIILAACDLVAAAIGNPSDDLPDIPNFANEDIPSALLKTAKSSIKRVREQSELADLWAEDDDTEWQAALDDLLIRLTPSKNPRKAAPKKKRKKIADDFLGHCYICVEPVTERDGICFEHNMAGGGVCSLHPHRACIEQLIPGPHWEEDGSPTEQTKKRLLQDMGFPA